MKTCTNSSLQTNTNSHGLLTDELIDGNNRDIKYQEALAKQITVTRQQLAKMRLTKDQLLDFLARQLVMSTIDQLDSDVMHTEQIKRVLESVDRIVPDYIHAEKAQVPKRHGSSGGIKKRDNDANGKYAAKKEVYQEWLLRIAERGVGRWQAGFAQEMVNKYDPILIDVKVISSWCTTWKRDLFGESIVKKL